MQGNLHGQGGTPRARPRGDGQEGQRPRGWVGDAKIGERVGWAMGEGAKRVEGEPWAAVVLFQVAVEVGVAGIVHWLTEQQEPGMAAWIEQVRLDTFKRPEELALLNALLAPSGEKIDDDRVRWAAYMKHVDRRNDFLHQGVLPTPDQARESKEACEWFQERLLDLAGAAMKALNAKVKAEMQAQVREEVLEAIGRGELRLRRGELATDDEDEDEADGDDEDEDEADGDEEPGVP
jgi:hypothetical protein